MSHKIKSSLYLACLLVASLIYYNADKEVAPHPFFGHTEIIKADLATMSSREITETQKQQ
ncbi:MAG: hypothetical protein QM485_10530 [Flavobacteriaceae bacterium]